MPSTDRALYVNIPIQMLSCTDTNGNITPMRFRFKDQCGEIFSVEIKTVIKKEQNKMGASFTCIGQIVDSQEDQITQRKKSFELLYSYYAHNWHLTKFFI